MASAVTTPEASVFGDVAEVHAEGTQALRAEQVRHRTLAREIDALVDEPRRGADAIRVERARDGALAERDDARDGRVVPQQLHDAVRLLQSVIGAGERRRARRNTAAQLNDLAALQRAVRVDAGVTPKYERQVPELQNVSDSDFRDF